MSGSDEPAPASHEFGGGWTESKLRALHDYLVAYATALKDKGFRLGYIDAFAGTGSSTPSGSTPDPDGEFLDFGNLTAAEPRRLLEGSARRALRAEPPLDAYVFIESDPLKCQQLRALASEFPDRADRVSVREGDANEVLPDLCRKNWRGVRAVVFLDPYGMQVDWTTIEAIARTRSIDLWILFPISSANRMLPRSGVFPKGWKDKLTRFFGTPDWEHELYRPEATGDLFGGELGRVKDADWTKLGSFYHRRLSNIFAAVAEPATLRTDQGHPLFSLFFAASNEKGAPIALKIARDLLKRIA